MDVLVPDHPPEVLHGLLLGMLGDDELCEGLETRNPACIDIVRTLLLSELGMEFQEQ